MLKILDLELLRLARLRKILTLMLHQMTVFDFPAVDDVQRNWRRCEILRGKRTPLRLSPVLTTWSWPNCCWTSESFQLKHAGVGPSVLLEVYMNIWNALLLSTYVALYITWWFMCLCSASDNIPKADEIRTLVKDIWDTRIAKLRLSADSFISQLEAHAKVKLIVKNHTLSI